MKHIVLNLTVFLISGFVTYILYISIPRNSLSVTKPVGSVVKLDRLSMSDAGYLFFSYDTYSDGGDHYESQFGLSRFLEPGVYTNVSFGEIYLPDLSSFGKYKVYIYHEDGDLIFDPNKDKTAKVVLF